MRFQSSIMLNFINFYHTNRCAIPAFFTKDILFYTTNKIDRIAVSLFIAEA